MRGTFPTWRWRSGLVTWTYSVPFRTGEHARARACWQRALLSAIASVSPFGRVARLEITTVESGDDALSFTAGDLEPERVDTALRGSSEQPCRAIMAFDLAVQAEPGETWLKGAAHLYINIDEHSTSDHSIALWFVIDVDIHSPVTWGEQRDNATLASVNGPRLTAFLARLAGELGARLDDVDVGDYDWHVDATGFH
jgi:hypothetical protein